MKGKKIVTLVLALLMLAAVLAGCGSKNSATMENGADMDMVADQEAPEGIYDSSSTITAGSSSDSVQLSDQKLIKTVEVYTETEDLDTLLTQLNTQIGELGGYIEYQNTYYGSAYASRRYRSASLTVRIPAENLDSFILRVEGSSNVISKTQQQKNVTLQYVDTQSRLEALETEQNRLLELMEQAESTYDLLEIEDRLTQVRYELESVASQLKVLDNQVSYATVELEIDEVELLTEVEKQTVWQRIGTGFTENLKNLWERLQDLFVWVVTYSPQLLILAAVIFLVVCLIRRAARKPRPKASPDTPPPKNEP